MLCGSLDGREVCGENVFMHVFMHIWLSTYAAHPKPSQRCLLISWTPTQNKKGLKLVNSVAVKENKRDNSQGKNNLGKTEFSIPPING